MSGRLDLPQIAPPSPVAIAAATARMESLTKPPGSLGKLEALAVRIAGIQGLERPRLDRKLVVVVAADHGVVAQGVSAYPQEVTGQMVANFLAGRAAVSVLAGAAGAELAVIDAGVRVAVDDPRVVDMRLGAGTADFSREPAMSRETAIEALRRGMAFGRTGVDAQVVACGEMGIGNTTAAGAIVAAMLRLPAAAVTGPGAGLEGAAVARKAGIIDAALALHRPDPGDPVDVLAKVGGFEIGVLAGIMLGAAASGRVVVVDGLISASAALLAAALAAGAAGRMIAAHLSPEPGHALILDSLGLSPVLSLGMRLGEGSGAALALPVLDAACRVLSEMATFAEAGIAGRRGD